MKNLITNNPYRIIGVYVGDSPAAILKNIARFSAFEKVGQKYEVSLVGEENLPRIERSEKRAKEAAQLLSLPLDKLKYSFLWFSDGKTDWGKTLNRAVESIVNDDYAHALIEYNKLITSEGLRKEYVKAVTDGLGEQSQQELAGILAMYFHQDNGYQNFLYHSTSLSSCFLSKLIYGDNLDERSEKAFKDLSNPPEDASQGLDFYRDIINLKQLFARVKKDLEVCRNIFGVESLEYQQYAIEVAKGAYNGADKLITKIGNFLWNQKYKEQWGTYKKYQTKMPLRAIRECLRLIKVIDNALKDFIAELKLNSNSVLILYPARNSYEKLLEREYVTDEKILKRSNRKFYITRGITLAIWLFVLLSLIFINVK